MNDLFIAPEARGSGLADRLIAACRERAAEHGAGELAWQTAKDNHRAQAVYERVGGQPLGVARLLPGRAAGLGWRMRVVKPSDVDRDVPRGVVGGAEISQATTGATNIYMGVFRVPPGARSRPHYHENCESAVYMLSGALEVRWGDHLEQTARARPGRHGLRPAARDAHPPEPLRRRGGRVRRRPRLADGGLRRGALGGGLAAGRAAFARADWAAARDAFAAALEDEPGRSRGARRPRPVAVVARRARRRRSTAAARPTRPTSARGDARSAGGLAIYLAGEHRIDGQDAAAAGWLARARRLLAGAGAGRRARLAGDRGGQARGRPGGGRAPRARRARRSRTSSPTPTSSAWRSRSSAARSCARAASRRASRCSTRR